MIGVNSGIVRQFVRGLPLVRDLRGVLMNLDDRLASLERRGRARTNRASIWIRRWRWFPNFGAATIFASNRICPPIFVDLFHSNTEYLWRNLVIAKLVQHVTGAPLVGLFGDPGVVASATGGQLSRGNNVRLASAFGVSHFVEIPNEDASVRRSGRHPCAIADLADFTTRRNTACRQPRSQNCARSEPNPGFRSVVPCRTRSCVPK